MPPAVCCNQKDCLSAQFVKRPLLVQKYVPNPAHWSGTCVSVLVMDVDKGGQMVHFVNDVLFFRLLCSRLNFLLHFFNNFVQLKC